MVSGQWSVVRGRVRVRVRVMVRVRVRVRVGGPAALLLEHLE